MPADLIPFADVPAWAIACVFAAHFLGFFIRGAFGFGSNMPIVLLTTWLLDPHHAILLVIFTATVAQIHLFPQGFKSADWTVARPLLAGMLVGVAVGTWLFVVLAADWLTLIMGVLITTIVAMDRLRLLERLTRLIDIRGRAVTSSLAVISGVVGTVSGGGGLYFLVIYLKLACRSAVALRGTSIILSGAFISSRVALLIPTGMIAAPLLIEAVLLAPVVLFGTWAGTRVFHATEPRRFYDALQILLLVAAVALVVKGIVRIT